MHSYKGSIEARKKQPQKILPLKDDYSYLVVYDYIGLITAASTVAFPGFTTERVRFMFPAKESDAFVKLFELLMTCFCMWDEMCVLLVEIVFEKFF